MSLKAFIYCYYHKYALFDVVGESDFFFFLPPSSKYSGSDFNGFV